MNATVELNEQELEVILSFLPSSWSDEGKHTKMIALRKKLHTILKMVEA